MRVGIGFDAHPFAEGRRLVLGGVEIDGSRGLAGHSDADVLAHAIVDALLGAAGLGDIGTHFPQGDPAWKDASSIDLLRRSARMVREAGLRIASVDSVVIAESPAVSPHRDEMRSRLAEAMNVEKAVVGVKGTTTDGMGFTGRGEGIAAMSVALLDETREAAPESPGERP